MLKDNYECFDVTISDKVAHIVLSRPEAMNSMNKAFWNDLPQIIQAIDRGALARVIVISSQGKHFTAGMDLSIFAGDDLTNAEQHDQYINADIFRNNLKLIQHSFNVIEEARMPVLMACQGGVIGGGIDMICAGDIRWCTSDAFFCVQETNIAMTADVGTFPRLQRYVSEGWVKQMAYTGERITAEKAREIGLVNEVFESHDQMLTHVMSIAGEISRKSPLAVTGCKALINYGRDHSTSDTLDYIGVWNAGMLAQSHMQEAFTASMEKREAVFPELGKIRDTAF